MLPGHPNRLFKQRENADGSLLLEPANVVSESQAQYGHDPDQELQALLDRAQQSPTVRRRRRAVAHDA